MGQLWHFEKRLGSSGRFYVTAASAWQDQNLPPVNRSSMSSIPKVFSAFQIANDRFPIPARSTFCQYTSLWRSSSQQTCRCDSLALVLSSLQTASRLSQALTEICDSSPSQRRRWIAISTPYPQACCDCLLHPCCQRSKLEQRVPSCFSQCHL